MKEIAKLVQVGESRNAKLTGNGTVSDDVTNPLTGNTVQTPAVGGSPTFDKNDVILFALNKGAPRKDGIGAQYSWCGDRAKVNTKYKIDE